jgi:SPP1 gp7 family putative phage head morphogenesis protein
MLNRIRQLTKINLLKRLVRLTPFQKFHFWRVKNRYFRKFYGMVENAMRRYFEEEKQVILEKLKKQTVNIDGKSFKFETKKLDWRKVQLNEKTEVNRTEKEVIPLLEDLFKQSREGTLELIGVELPSSTAPGQDLTKEFIREQIYPVFEQTTKTSNRLLRNYLVEAIKGDKGYGEMVEDISSMFTNWKDYRGRRIAITETARINSLASEKAMIESGVVTGKEWIVDGNPCAFCLSLEGEKVPLGQSFSTRQNPPAHPNCQCDIVPVFDLPKESATADTSSGAIIFEPLIGEEVNAEAVAFTERFIIDEDLRAAMAKNPEIAKRIEEVKSFYANYLGKVVKNEDIWKTMQDIRFSYKLKDSATGLPFSGSYEYGNNETKLSLLRYKPGVGTQLVPLAELQKTILHEFGHHIEFYLEGMDANTEGYKAIADFYKYHLNAKNEKVSLISSYAKFNQFEHFAEGFSAYYSNPKNLTKIEPELFDIMERINNNVVGIGYGKTPIITWKPTMTREEADAWAEKSGIKETLYHGTSDIAAKSIKENGFITDVGNGLFGNGAYMTNSKDKAGRYAFTRSRQSNSKEEILKLKVNFEKYKTFKNDIDFYDFTKKEFTYNGKKIETLSDHIDYLRENYNGILVKGSPEGLGAGEADVVVAFDKKKITVIE